MDPARINDQSLTTTPGIREQSDVFKDSELGPYGDFDGRRTSPSLFVGGEVSDFTGSFCPQTIGWRRVRLVPGEAFSGDHESCRCRKEGATSPTDRPKHHTALSYIEPPAFLVTLEASPSHIIVKTALAFLIHTAARTGEVLGASWTEIDDDKRIWTVPAERTLAPRDVCEAALAHTVHNKVEAAYRRTDLFEKRQELMTQWSLFLTSNSCAIQ